MYSTKHENTKDTEAATFKEPAKNAAIFKPQTLLYDTYVNEFRQWQNIFKAYYNQSNIADQGPGLHLSLIHI